MALEVSDCDFRMIPVNTVGVSLSAGSAAGFRGVEQIHGRI